MTRSGAFTRPPALQLATRYTWAINELENFIRNIGFADLAQNAVALKE